MTRALSDYELPRISAERLPAEREALLHAAKPIVVTDLLRGQPLAALGNLDSVAARLGALPLTWRLNYTDSHQINIENFVRGRRASVRIEKRPGTFAQYVELIAREPHTRWLITEQATPALLLEGINLRALGIEHVEPGYGRPFSAPSPALACSLMFAANSGNASDLHTDWDGRDVVLYQVFGRKRVLLFPPSAAPKLHPIDIYSTLQMKGLDDAERAALLAYAGGCEATLQPGEAIYMPAFWWHHVDYIDAALSVSFRFGGISDASALALARVAHRDYHVQNIVAGTREPARAQACRAAAQQLLAAAQASHADVRTKYRTIKRLASELHAQTLPRALPRSVTPFITSEALLEGALCDVYRHRAGPGAPLSLRWAEAKDQLAMSLRRLGQKLSHWA